MTLRQRLVQLFEHPRIIRQQHELLCRAGRKLVEQEEGIAQIKLEHYREIQGLLCGWLISIEQPEKDMRASLVAAETEIGQRISALEEHLL